MRGVVAGRGWHFLLLSSWWELCTSIKDFQMSTMTKGTFRLPLFNLVAVSVCKDYQQTEPGHEVQREIKAQMEKETQGFGKLYKCADQKPQLYLYTQVSPKVNCSVKP